MELQYSGHFELTHHAVYSYKINEYQIVKGASEIVDDILFLLIDKLARVLSKKETDINEVKEFCEVIKKKAGDKLSISSIAHFVHLVTTGSKPFDKELYGFNFRQLSILFNTYISESNKFRLEQ